MMRQRTVTLGEDWQRSPGGLYLPVDILNVSQRRPVGIDLFCGAGGFSLGFKYAGWHIVAAADNWDVAAATYLCNLGSPDTTVHFIDDADASRWEKLDASADVAGSGWIAASCDTPDDDCTCAGCVDAWPCEHFFLGDVSELTGEAILEAVGMEVGEVDCVFGGPPCQGFSRSGKREVMDPRNSLVFEFARLVLEIRPKTMVMENVPGMASMVTVEGVPVIDALARVLSDGGWSTYDALRRSLRDMPTAKGAVRAEVSGDLEEPGEPAAQASLFDEVPA